MAYLSTVTRFNDLAKYKNKSNPRIELTIKILIYIYGLYIIDMADILFLDYPK